MKAFKIKYPINKEKTSFRKIFDAIEKQRYIYKKKILFDKEKKELIIKLIGIIPNIKKIIGEKGELIKPKTFKKFQHIIIREQKYNAYEIKYIKDSKEKNINIFSEKFVNENMYNSILIFKNNLFKIKKFIDSSSKIIENLDKIDFIFIELKNISDKSYMFHNCNLLKEYKIFKGKKIDDSKLTIDFNKQNISIDSKVKIFSESSVKNTNKNINSSGIKDIVKIHKSIDNSVLSGITHILNKSKNLTSWNDPKYREWFKFMDKDVKVNIDKILNEFNKYSILGFWPNKNNIAISNVNNLSHMFDGCSNLVSIPKINTNETVDLSYMFKGCELLENLPEDLFKGNTEKVKNISHMFEGCLILKSLPDLSHWKTENFLDINSLFKGDFSLLSIPFLSNWALNNVTNMSHIFEGCSKLNSLSNISEWKTKNVTDMNSLFNGCSSLNSLPNISKWNTNNAKNIQSIFKNCSSLISLPDISKWNTNNIMDMSHVFEGCSSLNSLPDISIWNTDNVTNMSYMFNKCLSLDSLPNISKWNTIKITNMSYMFQGCYNLKSLPDISWWSTANVIDMSHMFEKCSDLITLPDISKWNIEKVIYMNYMFQECSSLISLPEISKWDIKNIKEMNNIFSECSSLSAIPDISNWDLKNVYNINSLFENCFSLTSIPKLSNLNDLKINFDNKIFNGCESLSFFDNSQLLLHENIYSNCINAINITYVQLYKIIYNIKDDSDNIKIFGSDFVKRNNQKCKIVHGRDIIIRYPLQETFYSKGLKKLELLLIEMENIEDKSYMFQDCTLLEEFSSIEIRKGNVGSIDSPISGIDEEISQTINLDYLPRENKNNRNIKNLSHMFDGCTSLLSFGALSTWNLDNIKNMSYMFNKCESLNSLPDLAEWEIKNVENIDNIFKDCSPNFIKSLKYNNSLRTEGNSKIFEYLEKKK